MTLPVSIRPAAESDLFAIALLDSTSNPHPWGESLIADALKSRRNWVIESEQAGSKMLLGWLTASIVLDQSELELIVIDVSARRQGMARKLMMVWLDSVAQDNVGELLLEVRESNHGAIALYKSLGFVQVGLRKNYYQTEQGREAACLFTKQV